MWIIMPAARNLVQFLNGFELLSHPSGVTIATLQEKLGISRRSVYRLFESFEELGFPLMQLENPEKQKRWCIMEDYFQGAPKGRVPRLELNKREVLVLYLILSRSTALYETELKQTIQTLKTRLEKFHLETEEETLIDRFSRVFLSVPRKFKNLEGKERLLEELISAAIERRTCRAEYFSFRNNTKKEILFNPLRFYEWNDGLYCFIQTLPEKTIRTTAVERFTSLEVLEQSFEEPVDIDPQQLLGGAWGINWDEPLNVTVRFAPAQSRYIRERQWTPNQKISLGSDGSVILKMTTSGRRDIKSWILSFGDQAELLEPRDLRDEICRDLEKMTMTYRKESL